MAACKSTNVGGGVQVHADSLPITCKLQNPPSGVTIAGAEYSVLGSGSSVPCPVAPDGQSFTFPAPPGADVPALAPGKTVILEVRIQDPLGSWDGSEPVWIVEDCDAQNLILAITSVASKLGQVQVEVT